MKLRGLRVIRAVIPKTSKLIGKSAAEVDFRKAYNVGVIAVQKGGKNVALSGVIFGHGDVLVLQASDDSPLLKAPPEDFYKRGNDKDAGTMSRSSSIASFIKNNIIVDITNITSVFNDISSSWFVIIIREEKHQQQTEQETAEQQQEETNIYTQRFT